MAQFTFFMVVSKVHPKVNAILVDFFSNGHTVENVLGKLIKSKNRKVGRKIGRQTRNLEKRKRNRKRFVSSKLEDLAFRQSVNGSN